MNYLHTFDELKIFAGLSKTESDYPEYALIRDLVKARFEDHCQRKFERPNSAITETVKCGTKTLLPLDYLPIVSVSEVKITSLSGSENVISGSNYKIMDYGIKLLIDQVLPTDTVTVTYIGGYEIVSNLIKCPDGLKAAALIQCVHEVKSRLNPGAESISTDVGSVNKPALKILDDVKVRLQQYLHPFYAIVA